MVSPSAVTVGGLLRLGKTTWFAFGTPNPGRWWRHCAVTKVQYTRPLSARTAIGLFRGANIPTVACVFGTWLPLNRLPSSRATPTLSTPSPLAPTVHGSPLDRGTRPYVFG